VRSGDINGLSAFYMDGQGNEKDGTPVTFRASWLALSKDRIGEIWFSSPADNKAEIDAAAKVLGSFRAP
jgi:hypothetical protein